MANNWDEFFAAPVKASKKLHVTPADVKRGARIDSRRREAERQVAEQSKTTPTGLPYGITPRPSGVPSDAPSLYAGELTKSAPPELISNALLAGNLGGLSAAFGALAPLRAGLAVGAGADAVLGAKAGEGDIPAVMSGAGMLGRRALPVALATGAAYAADAEAGLPYWLRTALNNKTTYAKWVGKEPTDKNLDYIARKINKEIPRGKEIAYDHMLEPVQIPNTQEHWDALVTLINKQREGFKFRGLKRGNKALEDRLAEILSAGDAPYYTHQGSFRLYKNEPSAEEKAIQDYRAHSAAINKFLRTGTLPKRYREGFALSTGSESVEGALNTLQKILEEELKLKAPAYPIYRGVDIPYNKLFAEDVFGSGIGSFSYSPNTSNFFAANPTQSRVGIVSRLKPENRVGVRGADVSDNRFSATTTGFEQSIPNEHEVLLAPRQGFKLGDAASDEVGRILLDLKYSPEITAGIPLYGAGGRVQGFAGGGAVKSGLKMMFPNLVAPMHVVKPKDECLPFVQDFVQDFVKNPPHGAPWADVGDIQNSGLRRTRDALNDLEQKTLREKGQEFGGYLSDAEIQALQTRFSSNGGKFASGGSVSATLGGWDVLTDPTGSPAENKLSWDIFSGHNDPEQLEAVQ